MLQVAQHLKFRPFNAETVVVHMGDMALHMCASISGLGQKLVQNHSEGNIA
jgi:hypothetical protein